MDARSRRVALATTIALVLMVSSAHGAGARTQNFVVSARDPGFARQVAQAAEQYRSQLAQEWLGSELPPWQQPCPIEVKDGPYIGAGGATSFMFDRGRPFGWTMSIQGSRQRILDSVLPHEVTHTIFATHFGRPVPRWADEGACTTVEHPSERAKQHQFLLEFLTTRRGIPFNKMFRMTEYPHDIMPLYSQGHSVARYLIAQGGKRKFVDFVGRGMATNDWDAAVREAYGFQDLSDLQLTWVDWVKQGCGEVVPRDTAIASTQPDLNRAPPTRGAVRGQLATAAPRQPAPTRLAAASQGSWYARQHDQAVRARSTARAPATQQTQERVLEWNRIPGDTRWR